MFGYFFKSVATSKAIANQIIPEMAFDYENHAHLEIIDNQLTRFTKSLDAIKAVDRNIALGVAIGTGCYVGAYLFPLVWLSIAASSFAAYNCALREQYNLQYRDALKDLMTVYQWSMGKETGNHWKKLTVVKIQELITTLGPWVSSDTIHTWRNDDLKPSVMSFEGRRKEIPEAFETRLTQLAAGVQSQDWAFRLYGENGIEDFYSTLTASFASQIQSAASKIMRSN